MSGENGFNEDEKDQASEYSPDAASAALRAAFLELSKTAWDIEKDIKASSSELFDSVEESDKKAGAVAAFAEESDAGKNMLEEIISEDKSRKTKKRKPRKAKKIDDEPKKEPEEEKPAVVEEPHENPVAESPADLFDAPPSYESRPLEKVPVEEAVPESSQEPEHIESKPEEKADEPVKEKKEKKSVLGFFKTAGAKVKDAVAQKKEQIKKAVEEKKAASEIAAQKEIERENLDQEKSSEPVQENFSQEDLVQEEQVQNEYDQDELEHEEIVQEEIDHDPFEQEEPEQEEIDQEEPVQNAEQEDYEEDYQPEDSYDVPSDEGASVNVPERSEKKESSFQNYWKRMFASEDKSQNPSTGLWRTIMRRELSSYFTSPIAYIVAALFLVFSGFLFFSTFFLAKRAELRDFFQSLPMLFSFFIPALTMRLFSEEKKSGSLETLMTLPVTELDVVLGKYLAALISSLFMLVPTVSYVIACNIFGHPDAGPIWGGYIGAVFLAAAFSAIGLFSSSVTKNQILAFFVALAICMFLTFVSSFVVLLPPFIANLFTFISASSHFDSISRGILDSRDLVYFVSVTVFFVALTVRCLNKSRKG